jgi:hypothetical protein
VPALGGKNAGVKVGMPHLHTSKPPFVGSHIEARRYILINFKAS